LPLIANFLLNYPIVIPFHAFALRQKSFRLNSPRTQSMRALGSAIDLSWYDGCLSTPKAPKARSKDEDTNEDTDEENDSKNRNKNRRKQIVRTRRSRTVDQDDLGSAIDDEPPSRNDENKARRANYAAKRNRPLSSDHVIDLNVPLRTVPYVEPKFYVVPLRPLPTFVITGKNGETFVIDGETTWEKKRAKRARNSGNKKSDWGKDGAKPEQEGSSKEMGEHLGRATYNPSDTNRRRDKSAGNTPGKKGNKETKSGSGNPSDVSAPRSRKSSQGPKELSVLGLASFQEDQGQETPWINTSSKAASERSKVVDDPYFQGVGVYNPKSSIRKTSPSKANLETQPIHSRWDSEPAAIYESAPARSTVVLEYVEPPAIQAWLSNPDDYVPPPLNWIAPPDRKSCTSPVGPTQRVDQASPSKSNKGPQTTSVIRGATPKALSQTSTVRLENLYSKPASDVHASQKAIPDVAEPRRKSRKRSRKPTSNPAIPVKASSHISAKSRTPKKPSVTLGSVARTLLGFGSPSWVLQPTPSKVSSVLVHEPPRSHIGKKSKTLYEDTAPHKVRGSKSVSATSWNAQNPPAKTWTPSPPSHTSTKSKNYPRRSERHNVVPMPDIDTRISSPKPLLDTWTTSLPSLHPRDSVSQAQFQHSRSSNHEFVQPTHSRPLTAERTPPVFTRASKYRSPTVETVHSSREDDRTHNSKTKTKLHAHHATQTKPADKTNHEPLPHPHTSQSPSSPTANLSSPRARYTHTSPPPQQPPHPVISPVSRPVASIANHQPEHLLQNQNPTWGTLGDGHCNKEIGGRAVSVSEWRLADGTVVVSNARVEGGSGSKKK